MSIFHWHKWGKWKYEWFHITKISYYGEKYKFDAECAVRYCKTCGKREINY